MNIRYHLRKILNEEFLFESNKKSIKDNNSKEWKKVSNKLEKTYKFPTYKETINFVNKVSKIAERQDHHPEMVVGYDFVKVSLFDHEKKSVSDKCYKFSETLDQNGVRKEQTESAELTEKCWAGYTQKGMKTMFGKRYPNCVKKKK